MNSRCISQMGSALALPGLSPSQAAVADVSEAVLRSIQTPSTIETSIGELEFFDGVPTRGTAEKAYDFLDLMRGVDTFLKGMPIASVNELIDGPKAIGATDYHHVLITEQLMDSKPLFLTANTSTL